MPKCLFINACLRGVGISRTAQLCRHLLGRLDASWQVEEVDLARNCPAPLDAETIDRRDALLRAGVLDDPLLQSAHQLCTADLIVIGAPYWDLSFPAALKSYLEAICVCGITFWYDDSGALISGLRANRLIYLTTAGGKIGDCNYGYDYVSGLFRHLLGVPQSLCIAADGLDLVGNHPDEILQHTLEQIDQLSL